MGLPLHFRFKLFVFFAYFAVNHPNPKSSYKPRIDAAALRPAIMPKTKLRV